MVHSSGIRKIRPNGVCDDGSLRSLRSDTRGWRKILRQMRGACRGGSWFNGINQARVTARRSIGEFQVFDNVGIRAAAVIPKGR